MRRAYETVAVEAVEAGHGILLDLKPLRTPGRAPLVVPTVALARGIAAEWSAQEETVRPDTMPLTQLAATAIDRARGENAAMVAAIARYGETDLVCYRAEGPPALVERQRALWQPLVDWAALAHDAPLRTGEGIMPVVQPPEALAALRTAVAGLDEWRLSALSLATAATGSLVIGLALLGRRLDHGGAWEASQLDETFQIEQWGEDGEAMARRAALRQDLAATGRFLDLLALP
jgi:chaperone required for assembly of F1-ATPase